MVSLHVDDSTCLIHRPFLERTNQVFTARVTFYVFLGRKLTSFDDWSSLCVHIAMDNTVIINDISKFFISHNYCLRLLFLLLFTSSGWMQKHFLNQSND